MSRMHDKGGPAEPAGRGLRNAAVATGLVAAAAVAGSVATDPDGQWYAGLKKPSWQPPSAAFPVVWTTLYAGIAVTSTLVLNELERRGDDAAAAEYRRRLAVNLTLNGLWSWLFFRSRHLGAATAGAAALAASSSRLAKRAGGVRARYGWSLAPYAAWTSFATVLAGTIWSLNRSRGADSG
ncbi:MAG: tryptophan-rich sensory protein [Actinobacteria bacterium]|nr:tryptophan-rich sensory protein [Actinomycetota bacterium]